MHRLSARIAPLLRTSVRRLPEDNSGIISDSIHHLLPNTILPEPRWPSPGLTAAAEIPGRQAFESFNPCATYFRSLPVSYSTDLSLQIQKVLDQRIERGTLCLRHYSTFNERDDIALEEEVERKAGWLLKLIFIVTAVGVASQFYPYIGDNLLQQSISLLHVKDPLFKRMGASRLRRFAIDDDRRMKVVEMGGARDLLTMLESAKDDKTRKEALKALLALSHSDAAAEALQQAGAAEIVASTPDFSEFVEIGDCKSSLLKRFRELEHNQFPPEVTLN